MQNLPPIALPLFFSNNDRERLFVTSRPSYLQMRASTQKCIMQPLILQMQQCTTQPRHFMEQETYFIVLPPFQRHFSPSVLVCVQAFIPNLPLPQSQIDTSLLLQSWYQRTIPALTVHPLAHTHTHTFCLCKQMNGSVFPHRPLSTPTHLPGNITPNGPGLCTHLSGYCWGNWPLTPPLGNWCRRRQKCAAYSLLHWRKRSPVPSIDLIFPPLCSL